MPRAPCPHPLEMLGLFVRAAAPGALGFWQPFGLVGWLAFLTTFSNPSICLGTFQRGTLKGSRIKMQIKRTFNNLLIGKLGSEFLNVWGC